MIDVLLVRHAHTYGNAQRMVGYCGETDKLDALGLEQIPQLGKRLSDRIFTLLQKKNRRVILHRSDTNRTRQTLELSTFSMSGIDFEIEAPHEDLGEIDMGDMVGKPIDQELFRAVLSSVHHRFPNGESRKDVGNRMKKYIASLESDAIHIIFSHGVTILTTMHEILGDYGERIRIGNATISHLHIDEYQVPKIVSLGE